MVRYGFEYNGKKEEGEGMETYEVNRVGKIGNSSIVIASYFAVVFIALKKEVIFIVLLMRSSYVMSMK